MTSGSVLKAPAFRSVARRLVAALGALLALAALALIWAARLSLPHDLYVSELGADGMPTAGAFRLALLLLVAGGALVALACRGIRSRARVLRRWTPTVSLLVSCAFFLLASQVPCTAGCPVPAPGSPLFTWQDFTHTSAAVIAFGAAAVAMLQCGFALGHPVLAVLSRASAIAVAGIAAIGGLMSVLSFYSWMGSRFEFTATTIGLAWVAVLGLSVALARQRVSAPRDVAGEADTARPADPAGVADSAAAQQLEQPIG
ncbi:hypothetical protein GCM10027515_02850 [Schumannella luteola]|uniref:DUF998 domain-containing protein n=1 Tax=Schumannella luteola TaxID=472059 RepID=A0A852YHM5_9MICO|nr:hypothetical protein [Schumannella luteola]